MGPVCEREPILRRAELDFDTLPVDHGASLRPEASPGVREFAKGLSPA